MSRTTHRLVIKKHSLFLHSLRNICIVLCVVGLALFIGAAGCHVFMELPWLDSFLNASMMLSTMGPIAPIETESAKLFASCYSLFCALALIAVVSMMLSPLFHKFIRKINLETIEEDVKEHISCEKHKVKKKIK
jgi:hypothetical protein